MSTVRAELAARHAGRAACRFCAAPMSITFVDLGMSPPCQTHIEPDQLNQMERFYPLHAWVCHNCFLVQVDDVVPAVRPITVFHLLSSRAGYGFPSDFSLPALAPLFSELKQGPPQPQTVPAPEAQRIPTPTCWKRSLPRRLLSRRV